MLSTYIKPVILAITVLIAGSVLLDCYAIYNYFSHKAHLSNYVRFESHSIEIEKQILVARIVTSVNFKSPERREKFKSLFPLQIQSLTALEEQLCESYPEYPRLVELYYKHDISPLQDLQDQFRSLEIKSIYENILTQQMLNCLAEMVYDDFDGGLSRWQIIQPMTEDSVYIGTEFSSFGHSKCAYKINGVYFEENYTNKYIIPSIDTIDIQTLYIRNQTITIDTTTNSQVVGFNGTEWKNIDKQK